MSSASCQDVESPAPETDAQHDCGDMTKEHETSLSKNTLMVAPAEDNPTDTSEDKEQTDEVKRPEEILKTISCPTSVGENDQSSEKKEKMYKAAVHKVLVNLISVAVSRSWIELTAQELKDMQLCLFDKIWTVVQEWDFDVSSNRLCNLHKTIFKKIRRKLDADLLLVMHEEDKDSLIVSTFCKVLVKPYRRSCFQFLSFLWNGRAENLDHLHLVDYSELNSAPEQSERTLSAQTDKNHCYFDSFEKNIASVKFNVGVRGVRDIKTKPPLKKIGEFNESEEMDRYRTAIDFVLKKLINKAVSKSEFGSTPKQLQNTHNWLFQQIWTKVEDYQFYIPPERLKVLPSKIFKAFCKKTYSPSKYVLILLNSKLPDSDKHVVSSFHKSLLDIMDPYENYEEDSLKAQSDLATNKMKGQLTETSTSTRSAEYEFVDAITRRPAIVKEPDLSPAVKEQRHEVVRWLVYRLTRILLYHAALISFSSQKLKRHVKKLCEIIWAEVEGYDFDISPKEKTLPKRIFLHLRDIDSIDRNRAMRLLFSNNIVDKARLTWTFKFKLLESLDELLSSKKHFNIQNQFS